MRRWENTDFRCQAAFPYCLIVSDMTVDCVCEFVVRIKGCVREGVQVEEGSPSPSPISGADPLILQGYGLFEV